MLRDKQALAIDKQYIGSTVLRQMELLEAALINRYPANVLEKKLKKGAKRIDIGYIADLAHIK